MYCVKCGVRLQDGVKECPLCRTPVLIDSKDLENAHIKYSDRYPAEHDHAKYLALGITTTIMIAACLVCLIVCLNTYGTVSWSGYVMLGLAVLWVLFVLPFWFNKWRPFVFIPVDFAAIAGYLVYICLYTGGHWFLSFAFPVLGIVCIITMTAIVLLLTVKKGRLYITGGLLIAIGCSSMLIEFFEHITFRTPMFVWSLLCVSVFSAIGLFLLISAMIPPLKDYLNRKFFY